MNKKLVQKIAFDCIYNCASIPKIDIKNKPNNTFALSKEFCKSLSKLIASEIIDHSEDYK